MDLKSFEAHTLFFKMHVCTLSVLEIQRSTGVSTVHSISFLPCFIGITDSLPSLSLSYTQRKTTKGGAVKRVVKGVWLSCMGAPRQQSRL